MATTAIKTANSKVIQSSLELKRTRTDFFAQILGDYEQNRFGILPVVLIWTCCLGGAAVGVGSMESAFQLALIIVPTMAVLVWCLAVQPMKRILQFTVIATIIDIIIITYNLI